jgi:DNA replication protein DnaC
VLYRETHVLLDELADAVAEGARKDYMESVATVPWLIIDDFGMRKLPQTAAEDLLEIVMRRYERASTLLTSNRPVEDWGKLLGDNAASPHRTGHADFRIRLSDHLRPAACAAVLPDGSLCPPFSTADIVHEERRQLILSPL